MVASWVCFQLSSVKKKEMEKEDKEEYDEGREGGEGTATAGNTSLIKVGGEYILQKSERILIIIGADS
jgi:hypothetical protein